MQDLGPQGMVYLQFRELAGRGGGGGGGGSFPKILWGLGGLGFRV